MSSLFWKFNWLRADSTRDISTKRTLPDCNNLVVILSSTDSVSICSSVLLAIRSTNITGRLLAAVASPMTGEANSDSVMFLAVICKSVEPKRSLTVSCALASPYLTLAQPLKPTAIMASTGINLFVFMLFLLQWPACHIKMIIYFDDA